MKRAASILLAALMICAAFINVASVGDGKIRIEIETASAEAGGTADVRIAVSGVGAVAPEGIASVLAAVSWSEDLTLTDAAYNCNFNDNGKEKSGSLVHTPKKTKFVFVGTTPVSTVDWTGTQSPYLFNWIALEKADAIKNDCTLITLTFKVADGAAGTLPVTAEIDPENLFDANGNNVRFEIIQGGVEIAGAPSGVTGDVNGDGTVNGKDLIRLRKYLNFYNEETGASEFPVTADSDCNGDGLINGKDLIRLRKMLSGASDANRAAAPRRYVF